MLLVSRCLLGENCRYNGKAKPNQAVIDFLHNKKIGVDYLPICPEADGKLPIPRPAGEIIGGRAAAVWAGDAKVQNQQGDDYTEGFIAGAKIACKLAEKHNATAALLKENSPSCGVNYVHSGHFNGDLQSGQGVAAHALSQLGLKLFSENELPQLLAYLELETEK